MTFSSRYQTFVQGEQLRLSEEKLERSSSTLSEEWVDVELPEEDEVLLHVMAGGVNDCICEQTAERRITGTQLVCRVRLLR